VILIGFTILTLFLEKEYMSYGTSFLSKNGFAILQGHDKGLNMND
jgi:hypothetical protein